VYKVTLFLNYVHTRFTLRCKVKEISKKEIFLRGHAGMMLFFLLQSGKEHRLLACGFSLKHRRDAYVPYCFLLQSYGFFA